MLKFQHNGDAMKKYFDILGNCSLFDGISGDDLPAMLGCFGAVVRSFGKKEIIVREGEPAHCFGIVLSGLVQIERTDYFGNRSIVASITPSGIFGESFACAGVDVMPVSVTANEPADIMFVDCQRVLQPCCNACGFHRQIIYNLMKVVANKNLMFHRKIEVTSKRSTREKLMTYLLMTAKECGSSTFEIPFDRQELADYLEVDRSGLSAEISKLRREGVLTSEKNQFTLLGDGSK